MKRVVTGTLIVLVTLALLAACTPAAPTAAPTKLSAAATAAPATGATAAPKPAVATATPAAKIKRGGTLRIHRQNDWETMDPHLSQAGRDEALVVYDSLVDLQQDAKTGQFLPVPMLAASWDMSNPKSIIFKLQKGVKFHDGSDFNAEVAKWNLDRLRTHPKSQAKEFTAAHDSVEVVDNDTIRLNLKYPSGALLVNLTQAPDARPMMISKAQWEKEGDDGLFRKSVGTGPFSFVEWLTGDHVTYKKNPNYWMKGADGQPLPYLDQVIVRYMQDWTVALVDLKAGNLDAMQEVAGKDVPGVKATPSLNYEEWPWQFTTYMLAFNARPGAKLEGDKMKPVRQAVLYSVDKKSMSDALGQGIGRPAYYHLGSGHIGYSESVPKYEFNLDKAKQLLAQAGYPNGIDLDFAIISRPEDVQNGQMYQEMLGKAGIRVTISQQERVAWVQRMLAGGWEMGSLRSSIRADPDQVLGFRFDTNGSGNYSGWSNAEMDKCLEEGRSEIDPSKRQKTYERCQVLAYEEAYYGFQWYRIVNKVTNKKVHDMPPRWSGWYVTTTWMD